MSRVRLRPWTFLAGAVLSVGLVAGVAGPAGAQQLIDAGGGTGNGSGGVAFVAFTLMVFAIGFSLFFMDRVRRRREAESERERR